MRRIALCLFFILGTACESAPEPAEPRVLTITQLQTWEFAEGPWGSAGPAVIDSTGSSIVGFSADGVVLSLDPAGHVAWRQGRTGTGPGEFTSIGSISIVGDTVYVADYAQQRLVALSPGGDLIETASATLPGFGGFQRLEGGELAFSPFPAAGSGLWDGQRAWVRLDTGGDIADTLTTFELRTFQISVTRGSQQFFVGQPLSDDPIVRMSPFGDGLVKVDRRVDDGSRSDVVATVDWVNLEGEAVATQRVPFPPLRLSRPTRDSLLAQVTAALPPIQSVREEAAEAVFLPEILPPVTRVVLGGRGEVWLRGADSGGERVAWVGVTPHSGVVGTVRLDDSARILASNGCYLLLSQRDALGVESISLGTVCGADDLIASVHAWGQVELVLPNSRPARPARQVN